MNRTDMTQKSNKKKKVNLKLAIYVLLITTMLASITSMSKFGATYTSNTGLIVAVPVFESTTINLKNIYPKMKPIVYELIVQNSKDAIKSDVSMKYIINANHIGNVPLDIKIYKSENGQAVGENLLQNGKTNARDLYITERNHTYIIKISWDNTKDNYDSYIYNGETSLLKINIDAVQKD